jgi:hypothetical protein
MPRAVLLETRQSRALGSATKLSKKLFSLISEWVEKELRCPGPIGTGLALLSIEQTLKRVPNNFFDFNFEETLT